MGYQSWDVHWGAVRQEDVPSQEQVDRIHTAVQASLADIFETHKGLVGWSHKQLVFN